MTRLTDTQRDVLAAAAGRDDGALEPLPTRLRGGAATRVINALLGAGLITPLPFTITAQGRAAIGAPPEGSNPSLPPALERLTVARMAAAITALSGEPATAKSFAYKSKAVSRLARLMAERRLSVSEVLAAAGIEAIAADGTALSGLGIGPVPAAATADRQQPKSRGDTKQAMMIAMLQRPEGATVEQIGEATGWQNHTIRAAISVALKKKLGLTVTAERVRRAGAGRGGAPSSCTVYRITG